MGLNDIEFPPALLAELYSSALIPDEKINPALIPPVVKKEENPAPPERKTLGENRKQVMIFVKYDKHPVIADDDLSLLTDILNACKLSLADVVIINISPSVPGFNELKKEFNPRSVLFFGVSLEELDMPFRFPEFQVQSYSGQQFLSSPSLEVLKNNKVLKSKLWVSLRKLFNI